MALAIILVLMVIGSVAFHFVSPWWSTPVASNWGHIDDTLNITLVITGLVFVAINLFIACALVRYRYREGHRAAYEPHNKKLEWWLIGLTSIGIVAMLAPGLFVYADMVTVPKDATVLEVVGQQWQWRFRFPGKDGKLGTSDTQFVTSENPFGLNPNDPKGKDDILIESSELHLPLNKPVRVLLRSKDVLHNFMVPQFRMKMDMVPGMVTYFWFSPTKTGKFEILCAEFCGVGHSNMRGHVVVEDDAQFLAWQDKQMTFANSMVKPKNDGSGDVTVQGKQIAQDKGCFACHSVDGSRQVGPTWKGMYGSTIALEDGRSVVVDDEYLKESILDPKAKIVQGFAPIMPPALLNDQEIMALIAYMKSN